MPPSPAWYRRPVVVAALILTAAIAVVLVVLGGLGGGDAVHGKVTRAGDPQVDVPVTLTQGRTDVASVTSEADGSFAVDVAPGDYVLTMDLPLEGTSGCRAIAEITVEAGSTLTVDFDAPAGLPSTGITYVDEFWYACFQ